MTTRTCYADPRKGVAFFDGVLIETDSITDPRCERILPILEEEQVFMCRQMKPLLRPGSLVLDVGTGSGVFAIWAALHQCRVIALDINPRALLFSEQNAKTNGVGVLRPEEGITPRLEDGQILLVQDDFKHFSSMPEYRGAFDMVILAPPYNPTWAKVLPPLHASAGILGQDMFDEQLRRTPGLLSPSGVCVGNQMTYVHKSGKMAAEQLADEVFGGTHNFFWLDIFGDRTPDLIPVRQFLEEQYSSFLNSSEADDLKGYIEEACSMASSFQLVYYEIHPREKETYIGNRAFAPRQRWSDRIWLHRQIVEHNVSSGAMPIRSLFAEQAPLDAITQAQKQLTAPQSQPGGSILPWIGYWMESSDLLIADRSHAPIDKDLLEPPGWDVILVDTAPLFVGADQTPQGNHESYVWLSDSLENAELAEELSFQWQKNTELQQKHYIAPFVHPGFIDHPNMLLSTVRTGDADQDKGKAWADLDSLYVPAEGNLDRGRSERYSTESLSRLNVESSARSRSVVEFMLKEAGLPVNDETVASHAGLVHRRMHSSIHLRFNWILGPGRELQWSALIGVPLVSTSADAGIGKQRGAFWIFVGSRHAWHAGTEQRLLELVRLSYVACLSAYVREYGEQEGQAFASRMASHETKHVVNAIANKWMIDWHSESATKIQQADGKGEVLGYSPKIVPFPELLTATCSLFNMWWYTPKWGNIFAPLFGGKGPGDLSTFIKQCYYLSGFSLKAYGMFGRDLSRPGRLNEAKAYLTVVDEILTQRFRLDVLAPIPNLDPDELQLESWMTLGRILVTSLTNAIRWGEPLLPINVTVAAIERDQLRFEIRNSNPHDEPIPKPRNFEFFEASLRDARMSSSLSSEVKNSRDLSKNATGYVVFEHLVEALGGSIKAFPAKEQEPPFITEFVIDTSRLFKGGR